MKAMILAAGKRTRVRPLTEVQPNRLIPVLGRSVMEFLPDPGIEQYSRDASSLGVDMAYSHEGGVATVGETIHAPPLDPLNGPGRLEAMA